MPGVVAVLTRDDILHDEGIEPYYGPVFKDQTIVAVEKVGMSAIRWRRLRP